MKAPTLFGQLQLCELFVAQVGFILDIRSHTGEEIYFLTVDHITLEHLQHRTSTLQHSALNQQLIKLTQHWHYIKMLPG